MQITTIGLDLAKSVFQVHSVDASGKVVVAKSLRRGQMMAFFAKLSPCLIGMEACSTAHYWARELRKLGHTVRLMPPAYVKPYVRRGKNDANDAAAICEAVTRPSMRFVPVKSIEQQGALMAHRTRDLLIRQRTQLVNALHGHLAELGLVAAAVLRHARAHPDKNPWLIQLLARRPAKVVIVALANKMARIAWAVLSRGETYRAPALAATPA